MAEAMMIENGRRMLAGAIMRDGEGTLISPAGAARSRNACHRLPTSPDVASARRWLHAVRRINRVEIRDTGSAPTATVYGVGHRRDMARPVSIGTALGLGLIGVPLIVTIGYPSRSEEGRS